MDLSKLGLKLHHTCSVVPNLSQARRFYEAIGFYAYREVGGDGWKSVFMFEPNTHENKQLIEGEGSMPHDAYYAPDMDASSSTLLAEALISGYLAFAEDLPGGKCQIMFQELGYWIELTPESPLVEPPPPLDDPVVQPQSDDHLGTP